MSVREMSNLKNRLTGTEICKVIWRFKKSVLIRPIRDIHANLVVLAIVVVLSILDILPIVANSTMSLTTTMTMAPVFHRYDSIAGILLGVVNVTAH